MPSDQSSSDDVEGYISQAAKARGIDPKVALRVAQSEGLNKYSGDSGSSFGPFQLHYGGIAPGGNAVSGLGDEFTKATGKHAGNPSTVRDQIDFALDHAAQNGWGAFHGAARAGIKPYAGIQKQAAVDLFGSSWEAAPAKATAPAQATKSAAPQQAEPDLFSSSWEAVPAQQAQGTATPSPAAIAPTAPLGINESVRALGTGIPIVGGLLNKANAATNALLAPALNPMFAPNEQLQGGTIQERYTNALAQQNAMDIASQQQHPSATTALNIAGAVGGTIPAMMAAPAAFGISRAPLLARSLLSGLTGAGVNTADVLARHGYDPDELKNAAATGLAFGMGGPAVGALAGEGVSALTNLAARTTPAARWMANALTGTGTTPQEASTSIQGMGPQATIADINPTMQTRAGAVASLGTPETSGIKEFMTARHEGGDDRLSQAVERNLGPRPDVTALKENMLETARDAARPYYDQARTQGGPMDTTSLISDIDNQLGKVNPKGHKAAALNKARSLLTYETPIVGPDGKPTTITVPRDDPGMLHETRQELDDILYGVKRTGLMDGTSVDRAVTNTLSNVRGKLDDIIKTNPAMRRADEAFSEHMENINAVDEGTDLFKPQNRIEDVRRSIQGKTPDQLQSMRQGALAAIHDAINNSRQGDLSGARSLLAKSSANRSKLDELFPNSGNMLDDLDSELAKRATEHQVLGQSATAERTAIRESLKPPQPGGQNGLPDVLSAIAGGHFAGGPGVAAGIAASRAYQSALQSMRNWQYQRLTGGLARGFTAVGPEQRAFLDQVQRAHATNALAASAAQKASTGANLLTRTLGPRGVNSLMTAFGQRPVLSVYPQSGNALSQP